MTATIDGNVITVLEQEDPDHSKACFCTCPYELSIPVHDLAPGDYTVRVLRKEMDGDKPIFEKLVTVAG